MKNKRIYSFFKSDKREPTREYENMTNSTLPNILKHDTTDPIVQLEEPLFKVQRIIGEEFHNNSLERDPGKRLQIWKYPMSQRDEIRRAYLKWGPYQRQLQNSPYSKKKHPRRFQSN